MEPVSTCANRPATEAEWYQYILSNLEALREKRRLERKAMAQSLQDFRATEAVQFIHVRPSCATSQFGGGVTICCDALSRHLAWNIVEISVSWCHPGESFNKLDGCYRAMLNWMADRCILMRVADKRHVAFELERIFQCALDGSV